MARASYLDAVEPGQTLRTLSHSQIPGRDGSVLRVVENRVGFLKCLWFNPQRERWEDYYVTKPKRKRDIIRNNERVVTYFIDHVGGEQRWAIVEYRIES